MPCRVCGACCVPLTSRFARGACRAAVRAVRAVLWVRVVCRGCRVVPCRATPCAWPSSPWSPCQCGNHRQRVLRAVRAVPCRSAWAVYGKAFAPSVRSRSHSSGRGSRRTGGPRRSLEVFGGLQRPPEAPRGPEASGGVQAAGPVGMGAGRRNLDIHFPYRKCNLVNWRPVENLHETRFTKPKTCLILCRLEFSSNFSFPGPRRPPPPRPSWGLPPGRWSPKVP